MSALLRSLILTLTEALPPTELHLDCLPNTLFPRKAFYSDCWMLVAYLDREVVPLSRRQRPLRGTARFARSPPLFECPTP